MKNSHSESYAAAGVDVTAGYEAVERIKPMVESTYIPGVMGTLGGFGGMFAPDLTGMKKPVLVSGTDGVGTKLKLAFLMDKHDTVGIDCVAMCVNDIICGGAAPLFFLDYITQADASLTALGFTEHSFAHVTKCAEVAARILTQLGYTPKEVELARIAAYMHDIGNVVNRHDHALSGATMAFRILDKMGMEPPDVAAVITAIGHHDDSTAYPVNAIAAALILADKTDVRRSRVRNKDMSTFDIHDRVNYSVERSEVLLDLPGRTVTLSLSINTEVCAVMDYFEIFLQRMLLSRKAAETLDLKFRLEINGQILL